MTRLASILLLAFAVSAGPSAACDPEEMIRELRAQCHDVIQSASTLVQPVMSDLSADERAAVDVRLAEAGKFCDSDKYTDGYLLTAKVLRFVGHVEARKGVTPVF
jgi:hypothetical protein